MIGRLLNTKQVGKRGETREKGARTSWRRGQNKIQNAKMLWGAKIFMGTTKTQKRAHSTNSHTVSMHRPKNTQKQKQKEPKTT